MKLFDRQQLQVFPFSERQSDLSIHSVMPLEHIEVNLPEIRTVAERMVGARENRSACIFMLGAHVIRSGVQRYIIDLMERGYISGLAFNGAGIIHDYELACFGKTTENVARYIQEGQFGLWEEVGQINEIVSRAAREDKGLGEAIGCAIETGNNPHSDCSLFAAGYRIGLPVTVHVGIGYDIVFEHPNCDGAAYGKTSYVDFLRFVRLVETLEGGMIANFGSAVMAPEIFLKALAMARNAAHQRQKHIKHFTALVCDLVKLPPDFHREPERGTAAYYFRPWKTMLVRTVADGGESCYIGAQHAVTIPQLWTAVHDITGDA